MKTKLLIMLLATTCWVLPVLVAQQDNTNHPEDGNPSVDNCYFEQIRRDLMEIKIATLRFQVAVMKDRLFHFIDQQVICGAKKDELWKTLKHCNADCLKILGDSFYTLALNIKYLQFSTAPSDADFKQFLVFCQNAIFVADEAINQIPEQIYAADDITPEAKAAKEVKLDFGRFVSDLVAAKLLKVKTLLLKGDEYYLKVSDPGQQFILYQLQHVADMAKPPQGTDSYLTMANLHYLEANDLLFETHSDIPADDTYANIRSEVLSLQRDTNLRMESLARGYLFLNVNPDEVSEIPLNLIKQAIGQNLTQLKQIDQSILQMLKNSVAEEKIRSDKRFAEKRYASEKNIAVNSQVIANMNMKKGAYQGDVARLNQQISEQHNEITKVNNQTSRLQHQVSEYANDVAAEQTHIQAMNSEIGKINNDIASMHNEAVKSQDQINQSQNEIQSVQNEVATISHQIQVLQENIGEYTLDTQARHEAIGRLNQSNSKIQTDVTQLNHQQSLIRLGIEQIHNQSSIKQAQVGVIQNQISQVTNQNSRLSTQMSLIKEEASQVHVTYGFDSEMLKFNQDVVRQQLHNQFEIAGLGRSTDLQFLDMNISEAYDDRSELRVRLSRDTAKNQLENRIGQLQTQADNLNVQKQDIVLKQSVVDRNLLIAAAKITQTTNEVKSLQSRREQKASEMIHAGAAATLDEINIDVDGYSGLPQAAMPSITIKLRLRDMDNRIAHLKAKFKFLTGLDYDPNQAPSMGDVEGAAQRQKDVCDLEDSLSTIRDAGLKELIACYNGEKINGVNEDGSIDSSPTTCDRMGDLQSNYPAIWADLKTKPKSVKEALVEVVNQEREMSLQQFKIHEAQVKAFSDHLAEATGILIGIESVDATIGAAILVFQTLAASTSAIPDITVGAIAGPMGGAVTFATTKPSQVAKTAGQIVLELAKYGAEHAIKIAQHSMRIKEMTHQLKQMEEGFSIDAFRKDFMTAQFIQRLAEMSNVAANNMQQYKELVTGGKLLKARCDNQLESVSWEYKEVHLLISQLEQEKETMIGMAELIQYDIQALGLQIANRVEDLRIIEIEKEKLEVEKLLLNNELAKTENLLANAEQEIVSLQEHQTYLERVIATEEQQIQDVIRKLKAEKKVLIGEDRDAKIEAIGEMLTLKKSAFAEIADLINGTKQLMHDAFASVMDTLNKIDVNFSSIGQSLNQAADKLQSILSGTQQIDENHAQLFTIHQEIDEKYQVLGANLQSIDGELSEIAANYENVKTLYAEKGILLPAIGEKYQQMAVTIAGIRGEIDQQKKIHQAVDQKLTKINQTYDQINQVFPGIINLQRQMKQTYQTISDQFVKIDQAGDEISSIQEQISTVEDQMRKIDDQMLAKGQEIIADMKQQQFEAENGERFVGEDMLDFQLSTFLPPLNHYIEQKKKSLAIINHYLRKYQRKLNMFLGPQIAMSGYLTSVSGLENAFEQLLMDSEEALFKSYPVHQKVIRLGQNHPIVFHLNVEGAGEFSLSDIVGPDAITTLTSDDFAGHYHPKLVNIALFAQYNGIIKDMGPKDIVLWNMGIDHYSVRFGEDLVTAYDFFHPHGLSHNLYNGDPSESNNQDMSKLKAQVDASVRFIELDGKALPYVGRSLFSDWRVDYGVNKFTGEKLFPTCIEQDGSGSEINKRCLIQNMYVVIWYVGDTQE